MLRSRAPIFVALVALTAGFALCAVPQSPAADEKPTEKTPDSKSSDSTTPLAEDIKPLEVELMIGGQNLTTTLLYSRRDATLFAFPVWVIKGDLKVNTSKDAEYRSFSADDPFFKEGEAPLMLQVGIDDLLAHEKTRKIVQERLWQEFPVTASGKGDRFPPERPFLYKDAYSVALFATSTGRNGLPKEVPVSLPTSPSEVVLKGNAPLYLELLPTNMALVAADRGKPLLLRDCFLRVTGSMKAKFEDTQCEANFEILRTAITSLRHHLSSMTPSAREAPEAFVQVPGGGSVAGETSVTAVMSQHLVARISVRKGASAPDYAAIQDLAKSFLEPQVKEISFTDDNKRIAVMMSNNATLSATVGDIKKLAKQTKEEREKQLSTALEEGEKRRNGQESEYKGSVGLDVSTGAGASWLGSVKTRFAGQVSGEMKKKMEEERASFRKQQLATLNRDLDELGKCFEGNLPTLTGISFDQKGLDEAVKNVKGKIDLKKFTVGPSQVNWSEVYLGSTGSELLGAKFLADELAHTQLQYKELHEQHEAFKKAIPSPERFADFEKSAQEARELVKRLKTSQARVDRLEKQVAALELVENLVAIPKGEFLMGSPSDDKEAYDDEKPQHKVTISKSFSMGKYKVTVGQFKHFVEATGYKTEAEKANDKWTWKKPGWRDTGFEPTDDHPVVCVSWYDADAYCQWLAKETGAKVRLPSEAEREYSCRSNTTTKFYFGDNEADLGDYAWYTMNTKDKGTQPCGLKKPNPFGLYDMHGLALEWCADGKREYKKQDETDPLGPTTAGASRVIRGGSFGSGPRGCRAAGRGDCAPSGRYGFIGFRVAVSR